jgi:hypothetical protein
MFHFFCFLCLLSPKCTGYLNASQNSPQTTNFSYIKQYSNKSGLTEYNSEGTASTSNIEEILERFQSKALRVIVDTLWFVLNAIILRDHHTPTVREGV